MTEKRFTYVKNNLISQYSILPIQEIGKKTYHCQGIVDELNRLSNENKELKQLLADTLKAISILNDVAERYKNIADTKDTKIFENDKNIKNLLEKYSRL